MIARTCTSCRRPHTGTECPRCTGLRALRQPGAKVCVRVGHKWPDHTDHVLAYFVDQVDYDTGMILVWDLRTDQYDEVPQLTGAGPWTRKPTRDEQLDARDAIERETQGRVNLVGWWARNGAR